MKIRPAIVALFDYRTFVVAGGFVLLALVGYVVISSSQAARDSREQQNRSRVAATRRIDLLTADNRRLQEEIESGREQRGELAADLAALAEQVRQLGGRPVAVWRPASATAAPTARPQPQPAASRKPSPAPKPRPTPRPKPAPSPSPSPTCIRIGPICI